MTTWMTPVGVALIVGGITTLIVLRAALFRSARRDQRVGEHGEARRRASVDAEARSVDRRPDAAGADGTSSGAGRADGAAGRKRRRGRADTSAARSAPAKKSTRAKTRKTAGGQSVDSSAGGVSGWSTDFPGGGVAGQSAGGEVGPGPGAALPAPRRGRRGRAGSVGAEPDGVDSRGPAHPEPLASGTRGGNDGRGPRDGDTNNSLGRSGLGEDEAGPGSRRLWPTSGTPEPDPAAVAEALAPAADRVSHFDTVPATDRADRRSRSLFRRLVEAEEGGVPAVPASEGAVPTDLRLAPLRRADRDAGTDDPGEPADQGGDPELDIDQDLDRAADTAEEPEHSRALDLPGLGLPDERLPGPGAGYDADLSGPFDAVEGADGTGAFSGLFADATLEDADETGFVPAAEAPPGTGWAERADRRYGDRVEGWIRPEYQDEPEAVAGEYWTPVPVGSYETEYGWPTPVERLPEVPPYPPSSGFDVPAEIEAEPTRPVLQWPPARPDDRIELPRSWSHRSGETGPAFRTAVDRDKPVSLPPATNLPIENAAPPGFPEPPGDTYSAEAAFPAGDAYPVKAAFLPGDAHLGENAQPPGDAYPPGDGYRAGDAYPAGDAHPAEAVYPAADARPAEAADARPAEAADARPAEAVLLAADAEPTRDSGPAGFATPAGRFDGDEADRSARATTGRRGFDEPTPAPDDRVFLGDNGLMLAAGPYVHDDETAQPGYLPAAQAARRRAAGPDAGPADRRTGRTRRDADPQEGGLPNPAASRSAPGAWRTQESHAGPRAKNPARGAWPAQEPHADPRGNNAAPGAWPPLESHAAPGATRPAPGAWPPPAPGSDPHPRTRNPSGPAGGNAASRVPARRGPTAGQSGPFAESLEGPIWTVPDLPEAAMPDLTWPPEEASDDGSARRQRRPAVIVRRRRGGAPAAASGADATQALPPMEPARSDQPRARPRPRPRPGNGQPEPRSTVYVSRHAAEPS